jgi:peptidyl-prolyl cis-trans isomerase B (cyclophilin B)
MVTIKTNMGQIKIELSPEKAPVTCANFLNYCKNGFYKGTIFHRVIKGFMIQGGGLTSDLESKDNNNEPIKNEADNGLSNDKYTIAMARTNDPHSATSQFFINVADNDFLNFKGKSIENWGYCVFGKVIEGHDIVDSIAKVRTIRKSYYRDVPEEDIIITEVTIEE